MFAVWTQVAERFQDSPEPWQGSPHQQPQALQSQLSLLLSPLCTQSPSTAMKFSLSMTVCSLSLFGLR